MGSVMGWIAVLRACWAACTARNLCEVCGSVNEIEFEHCDNVVLSRHGWHIIRLNATARGQVLPYETVRPKIAQALEKAAWARASRDFVETLAQGAQISGASLAPI